MKVVVLANLRWEVLSPSLYRLLCPADYPIHIGFSGEPQNVWYLEGGGHIITVPDKETGAMLLAKELNKQRAGGS